MRLAAPARRPSAASIFFILGCAAVALAGSARGASASDRPAAAPDGRLRAVLSEQREQMIDRLHAYWTRGDFVQNPDPKGGPGNFILDDRGKPCPLASIIIESGRRDLVDAAARTNNNVKIVDLHDGPVLDWILSSGLTQEECVLIQRPSKSGEAAAPIVRRQESERLAAQLSEVEQTLRASTERSLNVALKRLQSALHARAPRA
jgi:hypothetical protein